MTREWPGKGLGMARERPRNDPGKAWDGPGTGLEMLLYMYMYAYLLLCEMCHVVLCSPEPVSGDSPAL